MSEADLMWLVGYLEGEGCFTISSPTPDVPRYGSPSVQVQTTDLDVIERVAFLIGKPVVRQRRKSKVYKQVYMVSVQGDKAVALMEKLLPHMGTRRSERIKEVIRLGKSRPGIARGERAAHAKLTNQQAAEIREIAKSGEFGIQSKLAKKYGVTQAAIWYLLRGRTFKGC